MDLLYMTAIEAMQLVLDGKKVRKIFWDPGEYICQGSAGILVNQAGSIYSLRTINDEWEEYIEKPKLEKDPYVGKQLRVKSNIEFMYQVLGKNPAGQYYLNACDSCIWVKEDILKEKYYIEGIDF